MFRRSALGGRNTPRTTMSLKKVDAANSLYKLDRGNLRWTRSRLSFILICIFGYLSYNRLMWLTKFQDQVVRDISEESNDLLEANARFDATSSKFLLTSDIQQHKYELQSSSQQKNQRPLSFHQDSSRECLSNWISKGQLCQNLGSESTMPIDLVWTWQSQRHSGLALAQLQNTGHSSYSAPENDLLRFSIRSAQQHVQEGFGEIVLLVSDVNERPIKLSDSWEKEEATHLSEARITNVKHSFDLLHKMRSIFRNRVKSENNTRLDREVRRVSKSQETQSDAIEQNYHLDEAGELHEVIVPDWLEQKKNSLPVKIKSFWSVACPHPKLDSRKTPSIKGGLNAKLKRIGSIIRYRHSEDIREQNAWTLVASYACKQKRLPTFNPAVVKQIASEYNGENSLFLLIEPNHFFGSNVSSADFYSPVYGPVFRFSQEGTDEYKGKEGQIIEDNLLHKQSSMEKANSLIGTRFGHRGRHKVLSAPITIVRDLMNEMQRSWKQELRLASSNKVPRSGDIDVAFLYVHFIIERYREALLWSFFIARHDIAGLNRYSQRDLRRILSDLDIPSEFLFSDDDGEHQVYYPEKQKSLFDSDGKNHYLDHHILTKSNLPKLSDVTLTSHEGYLGNYDHGLVNRGGTSRRKACVVQKECFRPVLRSMKEGKPILPTELFKHVSFAHWGCGDCIMTHLLNQPGLSGFLPPKDLQITRDPSYSQVEKQGEAKLPSKGRFEELDFSLSYVASQSGTNSNSRLSFVNDLLLRYQHAISIETEKKNVVVFGDDTFSEKSALLDLERESLNHFSIIIKAKGAFQRTRRILFAWLNLRYPESIVFEKRKN